MLFDVTVTGKNLAAKVSFDGDVFRATLSGTKNGTVRIQEADLSGLHKAVLKEIGDSDATKVMRLVVRQTSQGLLRVRTILREYRAAHKRPKSKKAKKLAAKKK